MQKGFSVLIVVFSLSIFIGIVFGIYYFYNQQKLRSINSFEECIKYFPVQKNPPDWCVSSDGRRFQSVISDLRTRIANQKTKVEPSPAKLNSSVTEGLSKDRKVYTNMDYHFSVNFPSDWQLVEPEDYYSDINLYPSSVDINNLTPDVPLMGIRIADDRLFADSPKGDLNEKGIPMVTDWKQVDVKGLKGVYYQTHQCAPQCNRFVDFPLNNGKGTISIFISTVAREKGYLPLFEQMYQSFQFN